MVQQAERNTLGSILRGLAWPFVLGLGVSVVFFAMIFRGPLDRPEFHRYFASHPITMAETAMFFIGLAALLIKVREVLGQYRATGGIELEEPPREGQKLADTDRMLDDLEELPRTARNSYLGKRLRDALLSVRRKGSADGLDEELKYLADLDQARQQDSYSLVRIIIWAIPMLGFLGTVVGITQALGDLDPQQLATNIQVAMEGLLAGLYVAFDTTALALTLSIILMFIQFGIDRVESQLLSTVDLKANEQLIGRFEQIGGGHDPHLASVQRMSEAVVHSTEQLVDRQTQLWQATIDAAHGRWSQLADATGRQTQSALLAALDESLTRHAEKLAAVDEEAAVRAHQRWEQLQTAISDNARIMQTQQREMIKQGEVLAQVVRATADVIRLEQTLNENLKALAGAKNFEDTVMSLSAAIHLLNTRLPSGGSSARIAMSETEVKGRAA